MNSQPYKPQPPSPDCFFFFFFCFFIFLFYEKTYYTTIKTMFLGIAHFCQLLVDLCQLLVDLCQLGLSFLESLLSQFLYRKCVKLEPVQIHTKSHIGFLLLLIILPVLRLPLLFQSSQPPSLKTLQLKVL